METRKLAAIVVSCCNALIQCLEECVEMVEKELAKGGDDDDKNEKGGKGERSSSRGSRSNKSDDDDKGGRSRSSKKDDDDDDDDDDDKKGKGDDDEPSEDDIVDAARAALKVLDRGDVSKIIKKHGKADKASEVEPELRQKVIDELEKAVDAV